MRDRPRIPGSATAVPARRWVGAPRPMPRDPGSRPVRARPHRAGPGAAPSISPRCATDRSSACPAARVSEACSTRRPRSPEEPSDPRSRPRRRTPSSSWSAAEWESAFSASRLPRPTTAWSGCRSGMSMPPHIWDCSGGREPPLPQHGSSRLPDTRSRRMIDLVARGAVAQHVPRSLRSELASVTKGPGEMRGRPFVTHPPQAPGAPQGAMGGRSCRIRDPKSHGPQCRAPP